MSEAPSLLSSLLTTAAALAFVLALAWMVLRVLRGRLGAGGLAVGDLGARVPSLQVLRQWPLGQREKLVLIELRGEQCLLGVTAGGMQLLARWPLEDADAARTGGVAGDAVDVRGHECGQP